MLFEIIGALFVSLILIALAICVLLLLIVFISFLLELAVESITDLIPKIKKLKRGEKH